MDVVAIIALAVAAAAAFLAWTRGWPYGPCPACQGRRGRGRWSTPGAYNRCRRCGGSGERVRPLARIWPRHREEAARRKEERRK